jgi:hypothetical protein
MPQIYSTRVANKNKRLDKLNERNKATDKIWNKNTQVLVRDHTRMFGDNKFLGPYRIAGHDSANYILKECDSDKIRHVPHRFVICLSLNVLCSIVNVRDSNTGGPVNYVIVIIYETVHEILIIVLQIFVTNSNLPILVVN